MNLTTRKLIFVCLLLLVWIGMYVGQNWRHSVPDDTFAPYVHPDVGGPGVLYCEDPADHHPSDEPCPDKDLK